MPINIQRLSIDIFKGKYTLVIGDDVILKKEFANGNSRDYIRQKYTEEFGETLPEYGVSDTAKAEFSRWADGINYDIGMMNPNIVKLLQQKCFRIVKGCGNDTVVVKNDDEMYMLSVSSGEKITTIATDCWNHFAVNSDCNLICTSQYKGHYIYDLSYSNGTPKYKIGDESIGFSGLGPTSYSKMFFVGNNSICFPENINGVNYLFVKDFTGREYSLEERIANTHFNLDAVRTYLNKK